MLEQRATVLRRAYPGGLGRGNGFGSGYRHDSRCAKLNQAPWLPHGGSTAMAYALVIRATYASLLVGGMFGKITAQAFRKEAAHI